MRTLTSQELSNIHGGLSPETIGFLPLTMGVFGGLSSSVFGAYVTSTSNLLVHGLEIQPIVASMIGAISWGYVGFYVSAMLGGVLALGILVKP